MRWGIMCRMENPNLEENEPLDRNSDPQENKENENIEETRPWRPDSAEITENLEQGDTIVTPVRPGEAGNPSDPISDTLVGKPLKGYENTSAFPAQPVEDARRAGAAEQKPPSGPKPQIKSIRRNGAPWFFYPVLGVAILVFILLLSGFGGYASGISKRKGAEKTQIAQVVADQFQLGLQDMQDGAYTRARQRFEYVIQIDPGYPGASEKLAEVLLEINTTATPTLLPTATLTPTPDMRDVEQLYAQAQAGIAAGDWNKAIEDLLSVRKADPNYRAVDIDGLLFISLRNRGRDKILKENDLEGGIYDLTLASKFGPLDTEAEGLLNWTTLYITGASFWGIDWEQAVNYFSQVAPQLPNLMDGSKMTATERLRLALFEYGNTLASQGAYCRAVKSYQQSLSIAPDPKVQAAGELAAKGCEGVDQPHGTPKPGKKPKPTVNP
jgi:tetratricopeptide (TPR) repeat protein